MNEFPVLSSLNAKAIGMIQSKQVAEMSDDQNLAVESEQDLPSEAGIMDPQEEIGDQPAEVVAGTLTVKRGGVETEDRFSFQPPAIIGRFDPGIGPIDVDLGSLPEAAYVSRKHAKITYENGEWMLSDLGSSNGTFVLRDDFERIESATLEDGSEIALGNARFVFRVTIETS